MNLIFVVPVFNEEDNIVYVISKIRQLYPNSLLLVIDDCSTDNTVSTINNLNAGNVIILENKTNQGPGYSFNSALMYLFNHDFLDINVLIVTLEGDQTTDLDSVHQLVEATQFGQKTVLAAIDLPFNTRGISLFRKLTSNTLQYLSRKLLQLPFKTFTSFYRVYPASHCIKLIHHYGCFCNEKGFTSQLEILIKLSKLNVEIVECSVKYNGDRRKGKSKMNIARTIADYLLLFWRYRRKFKD
jgi:glycosyltransferase involved in cell wall biosynthesis